MSNAKPTLERQSESMPRLKGTRNHYDEQSSRRSSLANMGKLNASMEILKPLAKHESTSLMKMTGSKILGQAPNHGRISAATIEYKTNNDGKMNTSASMKDPYGSITV